jgi:lambda family phage holin
MPEKDLSFWAAVLLALREHGMAMMLTFILSYIRIHLYGDEPSIWRRLLEAAFGSLLVLLVGLTVNAAGLSLKWTLLSAGFVSILGIEYVRALAKRWAAKRVG